ncbi:MAG: hypothetical protein KAH18_02615 [Psychromonas sp.]|nr:hypothetical protein [Psychromonas sp.]
MKHSFMPKKHRPEQVGAKLNTTSQGERFNFDDALFVEHPLPIYSLCIGPRNDRVLQLIDQHTQLSCPIKIVYLDDLLDNWSFVCRDGNIQFIIHEPSLGNCIIDPQLIYYRAGLFDETHPKWHALQQLTQLLDQWPKSILCSPLKHNFNNSKPYQMTQSLAKACQISDNVVTLPETYIIKGQSAWKHIQNKALIVKSLSSFHSDVVDKKIFGSWAHTKLDHLPTLFQCITPGDDIRIHYFRGHFSAKRIKKQESSNYRYFSDVKKMQDYSPSQAVKNFCQKVADIEDNELLGIDFLLQENGQLICLEANPGPGWSAFHHDELPIGETFVAHILHGLSHD